MVVPSSGILSLAKIANEKNQDDYDSDDSEVLASGSISLRGLSNNSFTDFGTGGNATNITINTNSGSNPPNQTEPYSMSEFYGYDHDFDPSFHETTLTRGSRGGYGFAQSGYWDGVIGSMGDDTLTYNGRAVTIYRLYTHASSTGASSGNLILDIQDDLDTTSPPNSGWTTMKIYNSQSNDSGSPDHTFNRSSASYTAYGNVGSAGAQWTWSVSSSGTPTVFNKYWGSSDNTVNYVVFE